MGRLRLPRPGVESSLDRLDAARQLKLIPGTHRVLMAFPFSAVATPYRVVVDGGRAYFANCAWDAVAFHSMLRLPVTVESFCYHCGHAIALTIRDGHRVAGTGDAPVVYLGLPAAEWWKDIITTCSNTMLFFASSEHLRVWRETRVDAAGAELTIDLVLRLSEPLYGGKMERGFARPSRDRIIQLFHELNLTGEFWKI